MMDPGIIRNYLLAGKAVITLVSEKTQQRYTYKIITKKDLQNAFSGPYVSFIYVKTGPDEFVYMGMMKNCWITPTHASVLREDSECFKAFKWFYQRLLNNNLDGLQVWHEGRCGKCGKSLTVPESIARGLGPHCREIVDARTFT